MERKIIDYLPPYLTVYKEIKAIMEAEQPEFEIVWPQAENVLNDQFVSDSSTIGKMCIRDRRIVRNLNNLRRLQ